MSGSKQQKPASAPRSSRRFIVGILLLLIIIAICLTPKILDSTRSRSKPTDTGSNGESRAGRPLKPHPIKNFAVRAVRENDPQGQYQYVYDRSPTGTGFLISKANSKGFVPDSDAPGGKDLWIQDASGKERLIAESVYRAKFSPDGSKIAYSTSDVEVHVQDLNGNEIAKIGHAYEMTFSPDGSTLAFAKVPEGRPDHFPEALHISTYDFATGKEKNLTNGQWDDVRPQFHPSGKWILFVSGARSGLASFWQVPIDGGEPVQLTNVGLEQVNDLFTPTPYDRAMWSQDRRWFVYDYKSGEMLKTYGLHFDEQGKFLGSVNLGEGIDPRWKENGKSITAIKHTTGAPEVVEYKVPLNSSMAKK